MAYYKTDLDRYSPAVMLFFSGLVLVALQFCAIVLDGGSPVTPELYGPAVYTLPALAWVALQIASSALVVIGAYRKGIIGAWLIITGGSVGFCMYSAFAVLAQRATQGALVQGATTFVCAPASLIVVLLAIGYLRNVRG